MSSPVVRSGVVAWMQLAVVFALGLALGIWVFVSPWVLGYPSTGGSWTASTWTSVWVGGAAVAASSIALVVALARSVHLLQQAQAAS